MKKIKEKDSVLNGIIRDTRVITISGPTMVQHLRSDDQVLTNNQRFLPIKNIQKQMTKGYYKVSTHGFDPISINEDAKIYVRDVEITIENGQPKPLISWPYWISVKKLDSSKHMILSPFNPLSIYPYAIQQNKLPVAAYIDDEKQLWIQINEITYIDKPIENFYIELEKDAGIAVEYITLK